MKKALCGGCHTELFKYGRQDLNLHGLPLEPKSSASANSAMPAKPISSIKLIHENCNQNIAKKYKKKK